MIVLQETQCPVDVLLVEPGGIAELDGHRDALEAVACLHDRGTVLGRREEPAGVLQEYGAQLPALPKWLQPLAKQAPELVEQLGGELLAIDARLSPDVLGRLLAQDLGQALGLGRLACQQVRHALRLPHVRQPLPELPGRLHPERALPRQTILTKCPKLLRGECKVHLAGPA